MKYFDIQERQHPEVSSESSRADVARRILHVTSTWNASQTLDFKRVPKIVGMDSRKNYS